MRLKDEFKVDQGYKVDPRRIKVIPGLNKRRLTPEYMEYRKGIKELIRVNGITDPLTIKVEGEDIFLIHGHTRLWSVMSLIEEGMDWGTVNCRLEAPGTTEAERYAIQIVQNTYREFTPLEKADGIKEMMRLGWDEEVIGKRLNLSKTMIQNLLKLLECPQEVLEQVQNGQVSASLAVQVQKSNPKEAPKILQEAQEIAKETGSPKTTPKHVKAAQEARQEAKEGPAPIDWQKVGPKLRQKVETAITAEDPKKAMKKLADFYEATFGA